MIFYNYGKSGISLKGLNSLRLAGFAFLFNGLKKYIGFYMVIGHELYNELINQTGIEKRKTLNTFNIQGFIVGPDGLEPPTL